MKVFRRTKRQTQTSLPKNAGIEMACFETLEARRLMSVAPTADEQYMLELINRARANPSAEAARDGIDLNEGLSAGTISTAAKQPLAFNADLITAARGHSTWMLSNQTFSHYGPNNEDPGSRMSDAGYTFTGSYGWGENIAYRGATGTLNTDTTTAQEHQDLFIDSGEAGRGHRVNIETAAYKEIGVGLETGQFQGYNALLATQDFADSGSTSFLTGVAYTDAVTADHFYEPGEGMGNVTVTATNTSTHAVFSTTTWASGGYTLALPAGTYHVTATGTGFTAAGTSATVTDGDITIGSLNVEADFTPSSTVDSGSGSTTPGGTTTGGTTTGGTPTGGTTSTTPPTAALSAKNLTTSAASYTFTITYTGTSKINATTLDKHDLTITGPDGYRGTATFVSTKSSNGGKTQTVTYKLAATAKKFTSLDDGVYHVYVRAGQVADANGNFVTAAMLGYFRIRI